MPSITINGKEHQVDDNITLIQACEIAGIEIPRFCYHERLAIAGNCRMCLVEIEGGPPKPVASCATQVTEGMKIKTDSAMVKKAREGVMEFLLANHPLDCPICDQGGECDLQDQSYTYGHAHSEFLEHKRAVKDKNMGPLVKTTMTRCIHCTRCVRFITDVAGVAELGTLNRGENMEISSYLEKSLTSELSGNIIDLCPVGALTSKPYAFKARKWELNKTSSIDIMDGVGSNIRIDSKGLEIMRILPEINEDINEEWISDKTRFCYDGFKYQRLDKAYIRENGKLKAVPIEKAYKKIAHQLQSSKPEEIAALSGNLSAIEDVLSLKLLLNKLGSDNIDCRDENSAINANDRASYLFNTTIKGVDEADSCLIIGSNIRHDAPILNARIRKRYLTGNLTIATIGVEQDLTYKTTNLGDDINSLIEILEGKSPYSKILKESKKPMLIIGKSALNQDGSKLIINLCKKIAQKYNLIQENFNGFNVLQDNSSIIGAIDIGFTSKDSNINRSSILDKCKKGQIKTLYLLGDDSINIDKELLKNTFIIYQGSHGDKGAHIADVILPSATYTEKEATYINIEGRPQKTNRVTFPLGEAKEDWQNILAIAKELDSDIGFNNIKELRNIAYSIKPELENTNIIAKNNWNPALHIDEKQNNHQISCQKSNFFKSNIIARSSKILDNCHKSQI